MTDPMTPEHIDRKIQHLKLAAVELLQEVRACPALAKNLQRILVNIRMLELNCSDLVDPAFHTDLHRGSEGGHDA